MPHINLAGAGVLTATARTPPPTSRTAAINSVNRSYIAAPRLMVFQPPAVLRVYTPIAQPRVDVVANTGSEQYA